jgi:hypothetical protein
MVIDKKYRNALFSVPAMYAFMLGKLAAYGYTDIVCECNEHNSSSMRMIRKFGGVMLDAKTEMYHNYLLHNYLLGIIRLSESDLLENSRESFSWFPVIKRQFTVQASKVLDSRYIWQDFDYKKCKISVLINIHTGCVCGLDIQGMVSIVPTNGKYEIRYAPCGKKDTRLLLFTEDGEIQEKMLNTTVEQKIEIAIDNSLEKIQWINDNNDMNFVMYPKMDQKEKKAEFMNWLETLKYERDTGKLRFLQDEKAKICEMWPCFTYPYNLGYLNPEIKDLEIRTEKGGYFVTYQTENYIIQRKYYLGNQEVRISTEIKLQDVDVFEPIFNLFMEDLNYQCEIYFEQYETVRKNFDFARDNATGNEEVIFADFRKEEYSRKAFSSIHLCYDSVTYKIETNKACRCFHQYNYIGIIPLWDFNDEKNKCIASGEYINLGDIYISKM